MAQGILIAVAENQEGKNPLIVTPVTPFPVETILNHVMFNEYSHLHTAITSTLTVATNPDGSDSSITVADDTSFTVGDHLQISDGRTETTFVQILAKAGANVLELDRRIDYEHPINAEVVKVIHDMSSLIGSMASPQEFIASPEGDSICHVQRIVFSLVHGTAGDMALFGNLGALTNGVVIRAKQNGQYRTLANWKTNSDVKDDMFDVVFDTRASGGGSYGTSGRWTLERFGVDLRLDGSTSDAIEVYVQDDLTGLEGFSMKFQGHYTKGG
jgi:hypothetical protein